MQTLGQKIKELREDKGMTKAVLSRKAGLNSHTIIRLERDEVRAPSMLVMIRISEVLGVPVDTWVPYIKEMNPKE